MKEEQKDKLDKIVTTMIKCSLIILLIMATAMDCMSLISMITGYIDSAGEPIFICYGVLYAVALITHLILSIYFSVILFKKKK